MIHVSSHTNESRNNCVRDISRDVLATRFFGSTRARTLKTTKGTKLHECVHVVLSLNSRMVFIKNLHFMLEIAGLGKATSAKQASRTQRTLRALVHFIPDYRNHEKFKGARD